MWAVACGIYQGAGEPVRIVELTLRKQVWSTVIRNPSWWAICFPFIKTTHFSGILIFKIVSIAWSGYKGYSGPSKAVSHECHLAEDRKNWWELLIKLQICKASDWERHPCVEGGMEHTPGRWEGGSKCSEDLEDVNGKCWHQPLQARHGPQRSSPPSLMGSGDSG